MPDKLVRPRGLTDAEESEWWHANRERLDAELDLTKRGVGQVRGPEYFKQVGEAAKLAKILELSTQEFEKIRLDADDYGLPVPVYMRKLFQAALSRTDLLVHAQDSAVPQTATAA